MKILGNRVLVSRIEEETKEGFTTVNVQDSFVNKGKVEQLGSGISTSAHGYFNNLFGVEDKEDVIVLFAKYSPDTQEIDVDHKIINVEDILAIL